MRRERFNNRHTRGRRPLTSKGEWLAYEDKILTRYYPDEGVEGCSLRLDRSHVAIRQRAYKLRLTVARPERAPVGRLTEAMAAWLDGWLTRRVVA